MADLCESSFQTEGAQADITDCDEKSLLLNTFAVRQPTKGQEEVSTKFCPDDDDDLSGTDFVSSTTESSDEESSFSDDGTDLKSPHKYLQDYFAAGEHVVDSSQETPHKSASVRPVKYRHLSSSSSGTSVTSLDNTDGEYVSDCERKRHSSTSGTLSATSNANENPKIQNFELPTAPSYPESTSPAIDAEKSTARNISLAVKMARNYSMAAKKNHPISPGPLLSCQDLVTDDIKENKDTPEKKSVDKEHIEVKKKKNRTRKPLQPQRSPSKIDPQFRGVTFQMKPKLWEDVTQLSISAYFNCRKPGRNGRKRHQSACERHMPPADHSSLTAELNCLESACPRRISVSGSCKQCASCGTRKTPLWRDAEDGTPLCNACGIRYKKYRIRCIHCWHIPKKEGKAYPRCSNCGESLNYKLSLFRSRLW